MSERTCKEKQMLQTIEMIFRDHFIDPELAVTEKTSPLDIEDWDSLAHVSLLTQIENVFQVRFSVEEIAEIDSVGKILFCLEKRGVQACAKKIER